MPKCQMSAAMGPGWVKTKIHQATLDAKDKAGENYIRTIEKLKGEECNPMERVLDCCDWMMSSSKEVLEVGTLACVYDQWENLKLLTCSKKTETYIS